MYRITAAMVGAFLCGLSVGGLVSPYLKPVPPLVVTTTLTKSDPIASFYPEAGRMALTEAELSSGLLYAVTTPATIMLRFVDPDFVDAMCPGHNGLVYACTYSSSSPCQIILPAYQPIEFSPLRGRASWAKDGQGYTWDGGFAESLAHEILHCYIPNWHEEFSRRLESAKDPRRFLANEVADEIRQLTTPIIVIPMGSASNPLTR